MKENILDNGLVHNLWCHRGKRNAVVRCVVTVSHRNCDAVSSRRHNLEKCWCRTECQLDDAFIKALPKERRNQAKNVQKDNFRIAHCVSGGTVSATCLLVQGKENGVNILKSIDEGPFRMGTLRETLTEGTESAPHLGPERHRVYSDLTNEEKERYNADIRAINILLQGFPKDIYSFINHYTDAKDIWDNMKMLLEGSELTKEDRDENPVRTLGDDSKPSHEDYRNTIELRVGNNVLNPSQPQKNIFGFKPRKRANLFCHNINNSLTVQPPTQNDTTFMVNAPIKRDPSPEHSFTHTMSKRVRSTRGQASSSCEETMEEKVRKLGLFDNENHQMKEVVEEGKGDDEEGDREGGNERVGGSEDIYHSMSQGYEVDYPPYGYHGKMPPDYTYRLNHSHDSSS
nr:integrase, catalytic region, zinc finger, CCHC-type, peptidase aspartic, catalytic [Tanacetum cinerariifolium]